MDKTLKTEKGEVLKVLLNGEPINEYPDDSPYPSALFLGYSAGRPLHVLAAFDSKHKDVYIITTYEP